MKTVPTRVIPSKVRNLDPLISIEYEKVTGDLLPPCECNQLPKSGDTVRTSTIRSVLTDSQFWTPAVGLAPGIALLIYLP
ncbi:MAG: hypothetical protein KGM47_02910 [Acidobacteriota bacterium]|nr:hypothetical protein [Acidobacteriota bacterium]